MLWTCDPSVVKQLFTQPDKSTRPIEMMKFFDLWGPNVGTVEGDEWKTHRRIISSAFNQATNTTVWKETMDQTQTLMNHWIEKGSIISDVKEWTSRLALHVVSGVFFNKSLKWGDQNLDVTLSSSGHRIGYEEALFTVLARLGTLFVTPRALLGRLPTKFFKEAYVAFTEWTLYMQELRESTVSRVGEIEAKKKKSILGKGVSLLRLDFADWLSRCRIYHRCRKSRVHQTRGSTAFRGEHPRQHFFHVAGRARNNRQYFGLYLAPPNHLSRVPNEVTSRIRSSAR